MELELVHPGAAAKHNRQDSVDPAGLAVDPICEQVVPEVGVVDVGESRPAKGPAKGPATVPSKPSGPSGRTGPRICIPRVSAVEPPNVQKRHGPVQEGSVWPDLAKNRNPSSNWDHLDGLRCLKQTFSVENTHLGIPGGIF